jgi:hypothetical protein
MAYILWLLSCFGIFGFHRFYLGKIPTGVLWAFTGGFFGIGTIYDFFTLPRQVHEANLRKALERNPGRQPWRYAEDSSHRIVREKESVERIILKTAKANKGLITASELALDAGISLDESKKTLDTLVSKGIAELRVRKSGTLVYVLPEIMDKDVPLEDF